MQLHIKIIYGVLAVLLVCTIIFLCYFIPQNLSAEVAACKPVLETANNTSETSKNDIFLEENMEEQESVIAESQHQINSFDIIFQMPELPTGCEITALTMVLNYYGMEADKVEMATKYLPTQELNLYYGSDGQLYGNDLNQYFIGNPTTENGYVCGTGAIVTAANAYLQDQGSDLTAVDYTGADVDTLYEIVSQDIPVVVWVTISMTDRGETEGWYTRSGEYVDWSTYDHGAVLIGYTQDTVTIADPISGKMEYSREDFERVFASRGNQCVFLQS